MKTYHTFSSKETKELGRALAKKVRATSSAHPRSATVIAMRGDLGAGKTTLVQGFFNGLGIKKRAPSPTFVIMRRYGLAHKHFKNIFHVDAYRLKDAKALNALQFEDILNDPKNIVLIEWAERAKELLPKSAIWLDFAHGKYENERRIIIKQ
jgi:tRNA threonylcarbamoyl adenosine modification protein YjeE